VTDAAIALEGVTKSYGTRRALAGVDFTVGAGEVVGLLGPNGAGKSTTLAILATLLAADGGRAVVAGHALPDGAAAVRARLGFVPQQTAVYPPLTASENLRFFARMLGLRGATARDAVRRALDTVGLAERADEPVAHFSGGMRRRLNLACGILHRPAVVLLDEPTVGVDPQSRERIFAAVEALARDGAAVLYSTHYMEEAERLCARVVLLDAGRVVAAGTPAELVARAAMRPRLEIRTERPLHPGWLPPLPAARVEHTLDGRVAVSVADPAVVPAVLDAAGRAGGTLLEVALHRPTLADVFFRLTGHALRDEAAAS